MRFRKNIFILILLSIALFASGFLSQESQLTNSDDIRQHISELVNNSKHKVISAYGLSNINRTLNLSGAIDNERKEVYISDKADSLIYWSGTNIPKLTQLDQWLYESDHNRFCHCFSTSDKIIKSCFTPKFKIQSSSETVESIDQIQSLVLEPPLWMKWIGNLVLCLILVLIINILIEKVKKDQSLYSCILGIFGLGILLILTSLGFYYYDHLSAQFCTRPILLLLGSVLFLGIQLMYTSYTPKSLHKFSSLIHAFLTGTFLALFVKLSEELFTKHQVVDFEKINLTSSNQLLFAAWAVLSVFSIWLFFRHAFTELKEGWKSKCLKFLLLSMAYIAVCFFLNINLPILFAVLFLAIYYLTADLFYEIRDPNVTWLIWWVIIHSAFLSSSFYFTSVQNGIQTTKEHLKKVYKKEDIETSITFQLFAQAIAQSALFERIESLPKNAKLSEQDIKHFIESETELFLDNYRIYYFQEFGESGLLKQQTSKRDFLKLTEHYKKLNDQILMDPFSGRYLIQFLQNANFFILTNEKNSPPLERYSVFINNKFVYGDYERLPSKVKLEVSKDTIITEKAVSHIYYSPNEHTLLYARKTYASLLKPISIFSFIFCLMVFLLFLFSLLNSRFHFLQKVPLFFEQVQSLRLRIQLVIIFLILLSFITIAWVTSYYFNNILQKSKEKELTTKIVSINNSLQYTLQNVYDFQSAQNVIENEVPKLAGINDTDATFYTLDGKSNENKDVIFAYYPFYNFKYNESSKPITKINKNGNVEGFFPIRNDNFGLLGFLKLKSSKNMFSQKNNLSDFLGSILNLYVFLFLIAGAIAIAVSRSITMPLTQLGNKINSLKVGQKNEFIEWQSKDEIGELIGSYNDMVEKLDLNIQLMAKTERDMAWREMAKQVAHEIKNPLTPMKLSIQYLQQAIKRNPDRSEELIAKTASTLVEQIDNLTEIANAFSNVATLPQADNAKIVLNEVVEAVHDLFRKRDDMNITLLEPLEEITVFADKGHLVRILNNIVKNAIQSIPTDKSGKIEIKLYTQNENALISVKDNGQGIPEHLRDKVFTPKFTTKSSGSGLGLAIATNMMDALNGRIYFETSLNIGTTFYLEIPLIRNSIVPEKSNRVSLD